MINKIVKSKYCSLLAVIVLNFVFVIQCDKNSDTLAEVGEKKITKQDFLDKYQKFRLRTGVSDNGQIRRNFLKSYVAQEILKNEARRRGYARDAEGRKETERIKTQELLNIYHRKLIVEKIKVSDAELEQLYQRFNTKLKARHLYAPSLSEADSLYREIQNGKNFEQLAKDVFQDPKLRDTGGMLGYFTVNDMDPAFEDAAYNLRVGEISQPVKTRTGYSIIKLEDKITKPLLTEFEYATQRQRLQNYMERRKLLQMSRLMVDSLRSVLNISFNESTLRQLFMVLKDNNTAKLEPQAEDVSLIPVDLLNKELVRSDMGVWDVAAFQKHAEYTSDSQRDWIRSTENLEDFIAGLVVRSYIIEKAKLQDLHKSEDFQNRVAKNLDAYLLQRIENSLYQEIHISEDSLLAYYEKNKEIFTKEPKINLQQIIVANHEKAAKVTAMLTENVSFTDLVKKYSISAQESNLGYLTARELGSYAENVFTLSKGEWLGPLKIDTLYVFLKCLDKIPAQVMTYEEAQAEVEKSLKKFTWLQARSNKIKEIRQHIYVKSYPEKLISISYN
jgi:parvulin-like peptidyl-prolyl isomerase